MRNDLRSRRERYHNLSSRLAQIDDGQLRALFDEKSQTHGWGMNHTVRIGRSKVFVKRIPITELEYSHMFSTKNLYNLPTYYNYGVGSAGFGVFRELVTHIKTTNWVLEGSIDNFPLMYHYRIVPRSERYSPISEKRQDEYVRYWNGSKRIEKYIIERRNAKFEAVIFLEFFPYMFGKWFARNLDELDLILGEMRNTITFLRKRGIIHFDVHFSNMVTDGERPFLTDFGLVLDKSFELSERERTFFRENTHYDYGTLLICIGWRVFSIYRRLADRNRDGFRRKLERYGILGEMPHHERLANLLENIGEICAAGVMSLDAGLVETIVRYREIMILMDGFFRELQRNYRKDTKYSHSKLRRLLRETGFLT